MELIYFGSFSLQIDLIDKLVKLNVSRITVEGLIINYDQQLIEKWIESIHYAKAADRAAYLVKAIRENWQVPEGYLRMEKNLPRYYKVFSGVKF